MQKIGTSRDFQGLYETTKKEIEEERGEAYEEPNCECGKPGVSDVSTMEPDTIYCHKGYWLILSAKPRTYTMEHDSHTYDQKVLVLSSLKPCPAKLQKKHIEKIQKIAEEYTTVTGQIMTFDTFDSQVQLSAARKCINFAASDEKKKLILCGKTGLGKTHLARGILVYKLKAFQTCKWLKAPDLADLFRRCQSYHDFAARDLAQRDYDYAIEAQCVFLDDLGSERIITDSDLFPEQFKIFLENLKGALVVTTNMDSEAIEKRYHEKITSRLFENADAIVLQGSDYRSRSFPRNKK